VFTQSCEEPFEHLRRAQIEDNACDHGGPLNRKWGRFAEDATVIFDTDIFIWIQRGNPKAAHLVEREHERFISVQSYLERLQGAENKRQQSFALQKKPESYPRSSAFIRGSLVFGCGYAALGNPWFSCLWLRLAPLFCVFCFVLVRFQLYCPSDGCGVSGIFLFDCTAGYGCILTVRWNRV
jgi:hypothetical protein